MSPASSRARTDLLEPAVYVAAQPPHCRADDSLHGDDPALAATDGRPEAGVNDRRPKELEGVWVCREGEESELGVGELGLEEERERAKDEAEGNTLEEVWTTREKQEARHQCVSIQAKTGEA